MKVGLFLYNDFSDFEVTQLLLLLRELPLTTYGFKEGLVKSVGNLKVHVDFSIENLDTKDIDVFIIPGGEPKLFIANEEFTANIEILNEKLLELNDQEKLIAAICGGPTFLAFSGLLDNKRCTASTKKDEQKYYQKATFTDSDLEIDKNIITAKGQAFTEFAVAVAKECNLLKSTEDQKVIDWFRNKKE